MTPLVSVNIPTYNSGSTLEKCLMSVKRQIYLNIEIIIADGFSKDNTISIAKNYGCDIYYELEVAKARRLMVEKSEGSYIIFLDSDQVIEPQLITKCVEECERNKYDAITLFEKSIVVKNAFIEKVIEYDKWLIHNLEDHDPVFGTAIPRFFRAKLFQNFNWPGGLFMFDHNAIYIELVKQKGIRVKFRKDLEICHYEQNSLSKIFKRFYHYGQSYILALKKYPQEATFHSLPRRVYFSKKAFSKPVLLIGLYFIYIVKGVAAFWGVVRYFSRGMKDERSRKKL